MANFQLPEKLEKRWHQVKQDFITELEESMPEGKFQKERKDIYFFIGRSEIDEEKNPFRDFTHFGQTRATKAVVFDKLVMPGEKKIWPSQVQRVVGNAAGLNLYAVHVKAKNPIDLDPEYIDHPKYFKEAIEKDHPGLLSDKDKEKLSSYGSHLAKDNREWKKDLIDILSDKGFDAIKYQHLLASKERGMSIITFDSKAQTEIVGVKKDVFKGLYPKKDKEPSPEVKEATQNPEQSRVFGGYGGQENPYRGK